MAFAPDQALTLVKAAHANGRLAHALLVSGPEMADLQRVAVGLVAAVNSWDGVETLDDLRKQGAMVLEPDMKSRQIGVDPVREDVVGPAGPTTATRMDKFTEQVLAQTGLMGMVGKAERGPAAIEAIRKHRSVYLMAVGGAAYLVSKAIKASRVVGFADLGMEAIYEFEVRDMPVTVAVDSTGESVHRTGPREWQSRIGKIPVTLD